MPHMSQEEYDAFRKQYYEKPGISEMELKLKDYQEKLLLYGDLSVLPDFKKDLSIYAKSILLKLTKGGHSYIEDFDVDTLSDEAADNFLKRYFRNKNPAIGASFAGVLIFKVREVRSKYFKNSNVESNMSLDEVYGSETDEKSLSTESRLSYKEYLKNLNKDFDREDYWELVENKIDKEVELLQQLKDYPKLDSLFLKYLLYISVLRKNKSVKKLSDLSNSILGVLLGGSVEYNPLTPILESAILDLQVVR